MTISGLVVSCRPEHLDEVSLSVDALPWADVHHSDPIGRLVVTIEATDVDASISRFEELQVLPLVMFVEMAVVAEEDDEEDDAAN